jgi:hypothetical protein
MKIEKINIEEICECKTYIDKTEISIDYTVLKL